MARILSLLLSLMLLVAVLVFAGANAGEPLVRAEPLAQIISS